MVGELTHDANLRQFVEHVALAVKITLPKILTGYDQRMEAGPIRIDFRNSDMGTSIWNKIEIFTVDNVAYFEVPY